MNVQLFWAFMLIIVLVAYFGVLVFGDIQTTNQILASGVNAKAPKHRGERSMCDTTVAIPTGKHRRA